MWICIAPRREHTSKATSHIKSRVRLPAVSLSCSDSGQVVNTHVPLSPNGTVWIRPNAVMFCGPGEKAWFMISSPAG